MLSCALQIDDRLRSASPLLIHGSNPYDVTPRHMGHVVAHFAEYVVGLGIATPSPLEEPKG